MHAAGALTGAWALPLPPSQLSSLRLLLFPGLAPPGLVAQHAAQTTRVGCGEERHLRQVAGPPLAVVAAVARGVLVEEALVELGHHLGRHAAVAAALVGVLCAVLLEKVAALLGKGARGWGGG